MAAKALARVADVTATAGMTPLSGSDSGTWTAAPVSETTADGIRSDGALVVTGASCTFAFAGKAGNTNTAGSSTVTLHAGDRGLRVDGAAPLVHGDEASDPYGNTLRVASTAVWASS